MVLDIYHILKKYSSSKCKQTVCLHYGLDFHFKHSTPEVTQSLCFKNIMWQGVPDFGNLENNCKLFSTVFVLYAWDRYKLEFLVLYLCT